jgi:hypothetical protein
VGPSRARKDGSLDVPLATASAAATCTDIYVTTYAAPYSATNWLARGQEPKANLPRERGSGTAGAGANWAKDIVGAMKIPQSKTRPSNVVPLPLARPDDKFLLMAAAKMHQEGRLVQPQSEPAPSPLGVPPSDMPR